MATSAHVVVDAGASMRESFLRPRDLDKALAVHLAIPKANVEGSVHI